MGTWMIPHTWSFISSLFLKRGRERLIPARGLDRFWPVGRGMQRSFDPLRRRHWVSGRGDGKSAGLVLRGMPRRRRMLCVFFGYVFLPSQRILSSSFPQSTLESLSRLRCVHPSVVVDGLPPRPRENTFSRSRLSSTTRSGKESNGTC